MSKKWNESDLFRLLDLYESHDILWNPKHINYKNSKMRDNALEQICDVLNISSIVEVKTKLKSLRSTYNQELLKINISQSGGAPADEIYKPKLVWFDKADSFLRNVTSRRQRRISYDFKQEPQFIIVEGQEFDTLEDNLESAVEPCDLVDDHPIETSTHSTASYLPPARKRSKKSHAMPSYSGLTTAISDLKKLADANKEVHEFDIFGNYVASCMKKLPLERALRLQEKLNSDINEERMSFLRECSAQEQKTGIQSWSSSTSFSDSDNPHNSLSSPMQNNHSQTTRNNFTVLGQSMQASGRAVDGDKSSIP